MPDGRPVQLFTLTNAGGLVARITNYGATITELLVPDRAGRLDDVVLGFDDLAGYLGSRDYIGCTIGRVANRIAGGRFTLGSGTHQLTLNDGANHLHGGRQGLDKVLWDAEPPPGKAAALRLSHGSPDGHEGYPGRLDITVVMTLTDAGELILDYTARSDRPTPINLTNHSYFNLSGQGDILGHELMIAASNYTPTDDRLIPTGAIAPVRGTPFDFTRSTAIGARLDERPAAQGGYDQNYVLDRNSKVAARVYEPRSGRVVELMTTEPGVQLHTASFVEGAVSGKRQIRYGRHAGLALEAQHFPDSVNQPGFPGTILKLGETYRQTTTYKFSVRG